MEVLVSAERSSEDRRAAGQAREVLPATAGLEHLTRRSLLDCGAADRSSRFRRDRQGRGRGEMESSPTGGRKVCEKTRQDGRG